jgi:hypothetical protein
MVNTNYHKSINKTLISRNYFYGVQKGLLLRNSHHERLDLQLIFCEASEKTLQILGAFGWLSTKLSTIQLRLCETALSNRNQGASLRIVIGTTVIGNALCLRI